MTDKIAPQAQLFMDHIPYSGALGMQMTHASDGKAEIQMAYDPHFVGEPASGVLHGGVVSALIDTCCGTAVSTHPEVSISVATLGLRIAYLRKAEVGQTLRARAECYHVTRSVAFVRAQAFDDDETLPVATAAGSFALTGPAREGNT